MPSGVPVTTVGINNAKNAGLLAARILGIKNKEIYDKLNAKVDQMKENLVYDLSEKLKECSQVDDIPTSKIK